MNASFEPRLGNEQHARARGEAAGASFGKKATVAFLMATAVFLSLMGAGAAGIGLGGFQPVLMVFAFAVVCGFGYFLPTLIARHVEHKNFSAIAILNLLLGWTFLGWVVALVWAVKR
jgi:hypothetical protein